ncbi:helix-turn-helix domain-containing protein [Micromonospora sp. NBC_01699]|uniref:winged helix-turn-helix domain-containing protein n=1 Tax=Micromonospora sp. NBC_01699 TaxID=2975984 RepID=UPI002E2B941D|nr:helix-turn-helix domain-containing protein [Micromonospora sp. NBC_01699]
MPQPAVRDIGNPRALRAMAHPLRLRVLDAVAFSGPATATAISEQVGESPANCSWQLGQLASYGFVEEAGGGTGRQRPWRIVLQRYRWGPAAPAAFHTDNADPEAFRTGEVDPASAHGVRGPEPRVGAALPSLTGPDARSPGSRPVRFIAWGVPARPPERDAADDG